MGKGEARNSEEATETTEAKEVMEAAVIELHTREGVAERDTEVDAGGGVNRKANLHSTMSAILHRIR